MEALTANDTAALFHAQPYDISAQGFYFRDRAEFNRKIKACRNSYGERVEEFEIQFIDGGELDGLLFDALGIHQGTIALFMDKRDEWDDGDKIRLIIAIGECGYSFTFGQDEPDDFPVDLYADMTLIDLAHQFVEDGLYGEIASLLEGYIDYAAMARDLGYDYTETVIAGVPYVYRYW